MEVNPELALKEMLPIAFERFNTSLTLWSLQLTVILGILAFAVSSKALFNALRFRIVICVGYLIFSLANLLTLIDVVGQRRVINLYVKSLHETKQLIGLENYLNAPPTFGVIGLHFVDDAVAVGIIMWLPKFRAVLREPA